MHLTPDFFQRVVESLAAGKMTWSNERRGGPRFGLSGEAELTPLSDGRFPTHEPARVRDVSAHGVGIISQQHVSPGAQFLLEFDAPDRAGHEPVRVVCVAQHCRKVAEHGYRVGARFVREADDALPRAVAA